MTEHFWRSQGLDELKMVSNRITYPTIDFEIVTTDLNLYFSNTVNFIEHSIFPGTQSDVLLKVQIHGFNWEQCLNIYQRAATNLSNKQLCAGGEEEKGTCGGDSGDLIDFCIRQHIVMYLWLLKYKQAVL